MKISVPGRYLTGSRKTTGLVVPVKFPPGTRPLCTTMGLQPLSRSTDAHLFSTRPSTTSIFSTRNLRGVPRVVLTTGILLPFSRKTYGPSSLCSFRGPSDNTRNLRPILGHGAATVGFVSRFATFPPWRVI